MTINIELRDANNELKKLKDQYNALSYKEKESKKGIDILFEMYYYEQEISKHLQKVRDIASESVLKTINLEII